MTTMLCPFLPMQSLSKQRRTSASTASSAGAPPKTTVSKLSLSKKRGQAQPQVQLWCGLVRVVVSCILD
jgi:hypothetical protein